MQKSEEIHFFCWNYIIEGDEFMKQHLTTFKERSEKPLKIILVGGILFSIASMAVYYYFELKEMNFEEESPPLVLNDEKEDTKVENQVVENTAKEDKPWMVDLKGEVLLPGTYEVNPDMRIMDVISKAGGFTENANTALINLSRKVEDEMVIIVYNQKEVKSYFDKKEKENLITEACNQLSSSQNDACLQEDDFLSQEEEKTDSNEKETKKININTATKEELMSLPGIGEAKAELILTYRKETPFKQIEDLKNVKGIGESLFEGLKDQIIVS